MSLPNDSLLGKRIDEYQIDMPLGAGGMARVYRALDTKLQRYVALKVIAPELRTDNEHALRFEREAQSIARLEHPNIVHIYRFGESSGLYYIAMQYIQGADVGRLIEDYRNNGEFMPIDDIVSIIDQIGGALDYAHSKGVIHRDVKPNNIIVNQQERAILTDFGLVLLSDAGTQGEIFGSPSYIAPEQAISSANVVPQSDIYALGVTLFEMLTGELPFPGSDPMEIAMRHVSEPPPAPSQLNKTIPAAVDQVVLRSLAKEPADRYQTGQEFSAAFQNAVAGWKQANSTLDVEPPRPSSIPEMVEEIVAAHINKLADSDAYCGYHVWNRHYCPDCRFLHYSQQQLTIVSGSSYRNASINRNGIAPDTNLITDQYGTSPDTNGGAVGLTQCNFAKYVAATGPQPSTSR